MGVGGRADVIENNEHLSHSSTEESEENVCPPQRQSVSEEVYPRVDETS